MLEDGLLNKYWEYNAADRETYYFRGMYLRVLRAIEYMTSLPEWDGRRLLVVGESQGGGQAVAAAGLDPRVSAVVLNVPAMQDLGGARKGRLSGWPQPIENHQDLSPVQLDNTLPSRRPSTACPTAPTPGPLVICVPLGKRSISTPARHSSTSI